MTPPSTVPSGDVSHSVAGIRPVVSVIVTSDRPRRRLACTTVPRATSRPDSGTGRSMLIASSVVVYPVPAGRTECTAHPSGPSARIATSPPVTAPCGVFSQSVIGMVKVAVPPPTSVNRMPVR